MKRKEFLSMVLLSPLAVLHKKEDIRQDVKPIKLELRNGSEIYYTPPISPAWVKELYPEYLNTIKGTI